MQRLIDKFTIYFESIWQTLLANTSISGLRLCVLYILNCKVSTSKTFRVAYFTNVRIYRQKKEIWSTCKCVILPGVGGGGGGGRGELSRRGKNTYSAYAYSIHVLTKWPKIYIAVMEHIYMQSYLMVSEKYENVLSICSHFLKVNKKGNVSNRPQIYEFCALKMLVSPFHNFVFAVPNMLSMLWPG